jgi:hypothetical protein
MNVKRAYIHNINTLNRLIKEERASRLVLTENMDR